MRKSFLFAAAFGLMLSAFAFRVSSAAEAGSAFAQALTQSIEEPAPRILVNGDELRAEPSPTRRDGVVYIPVGGGLANALGADVVFGKSEGGAFTASLRTEDATVVFTEHETRFTVNGLPRELPTAPFLESGFPMVPVKEFFEALGFKVEWDEKAKTMNMTRMARASTIRDELDVIFAAPKTATATATAEPGGKAGKPAKPKKPMLEYTYDNTLGFENTAVSGKKGQSNLVPRSIATNQFNIRAQRLMSNGYMFNSSMRTISTTDDAQNRGQMSKLALNMEKGGVSASAYDMFPKFTYYALKNYQMRGLQYERKNKGYAWTALAGKSPKIAGDSEYARYVQGFRLHRSVVKSRDFGITYVRTKDTGSQLGSERIDNNVITVNNLSRFGANTKILSEFAYSHTKTNGGLTEAGKARSVAAQYRDSMNSCSFVYERNGADFNSETAVFTQGRREVSLMMNRRLNKRSQAGGGMKSVRLRGEETKTTPLMYSIMPWKARPAMKFTMQRNYEKSRGEDGSRFTSNGSFAFTDVFGSVKTDATLERRRQKDANGFMSFRTLQRYRMEISLSEKTEASLQYKWERRTTGANRLTRFYQAQISHELKEWNDLTFGVGRYYNATINNRTNFSVGYKKVDIENSTEMNATYEFYNYRDHNDNVVRFDYSFNR